MSIINSILDTDAYKLTQQQAVLNLYPDVPVEYKFINRNPKYKFDAQFANYLSQEIKNLSDLSLTQEEESFLTKHGFKPWYIAFLSKYKFNPQEVSFSIEDGNLNLKVAGMWHNAILWEVPLMAIISELYFKYIHKDWNYDGQVEQILAKKNSFIQESLWLPEEIKFSDFGTRRRRSFKSQAIVVANTNVNTSNVYLAMKCDRQPIGTVAHEWFLGVSALEGLRHANRFALKKWQTMYKNSIALTDTYGVDAFLKDFDTELATEYAGVRHDSGCPFEWASKMQKHYIKLGVPFENKKLVFSDGLTCKKTIEINQFCQEIGFKNIHYGIGTHLTNHYPDGLALNIVIKMTKCDNIDVVKLSDEPGKAVGAPDTLRIAKNIFFGTPL